MMFEEWHKNRFGWEKRVRRKVEIREVEFRARSNKAFTWIMRERIQWWLPRTNFKQIL